MHTNVGNQTSVWTITERFQPLIQRTTTCIMFCDTDCIEGCSGPFRTTQPTQTCALSTMVAVNLLRHVIPTAHECLAGVACQCLTRSDQIISPVARTMSKDTLKISAARSRSSALQRRQTACSVNRPHDHFCTQGNGGRTLTAFLQISQLVNFFSHSSRSQHHLWNK